MGMERVAKVLRRFAYAKDFTTPPSMFWMSAEQAEAWKGDKRRAYYQKLKAWWRGVPKAKKAATLRFMRRAAPTPAAGTRRHFQVRTRTATNWPEPEPD